MAGAKLIVIYARPTDTEFLRARVPEPTCAHGRRAVGRQDQDCGEQNS
jgi:hypothetical protein